jgi:hypothetical protein
MAHQMTSTSDLLAKFMADQQEETWDRVGQALGGRGRG